MSEQGFHTHALASTEQEEILALLPLPKREAGPCLLPRLTQQTVHSKQDGGTVPQKVAVTLLRIALNLGKIVILKYCIFIHEDDLSHY